MVIKQLSEIKSTLVDITQQQTVTESKLDDLNGRVQSEQSSTHPNLSTNLKLPLQTLLELESLEEQLSDEIFKNTLVS